MKLGEEHVPTMENSISTGCLSLDVALGVGGAERKDRRNIWPRIIW